MKRLLGTLIVVILVFAALHEGIAGPGNRTGTGGAAQLLIPVGARDLAMGGSTISTTRGIESLFWNPAGVAKTDKAVGLIFSHMSYIADIGVEYGAVSGKFGDLGSFALSVKSLSVGDIPVTTTENPDGTGQNYSPQFFIAGITYSRMLSDRISVGVTANLVSERLADVSASGAAFNVGVIYDNLADMTGLSLGVVVKNIGPQMRYDGPALYQIGDVGDQNRPPQYMKIDTAPFEMPASIEIGMGYRSSVSENADLLFSGAFQSNNFSEDEYRLGAEMGFNKMFFIRGGYALAPDTPEDSEYIYGVTVGGGIQYNLGDADLAVDYAFRDTEFFSGNHVISVRLGF
jgi:hypothetical protein